MMNIVKGQKAEYHGILLTPQEYIEYQQYLEIREEIEEYQKSHTKTLTK